MLLPTRTTIPPTHTAISSLRATHITPQQTITSNKMLTTIARSKRVSHALALFFGLALGTITALKTFGAAVPPPEKLLSDDTLLVVTAPDFSKLRETFKNSPQSQLWHDPALRSFREHFMEKWNEEFVKPLERELDVRLDDYTSLPQGQVTFALTQLGAAKNGEKLGLLFLVDTKSKSGQLKTNLTNLRKKWIDSGKKLRTEKIRDVEFSIVSLSSNDVPSTLKEFFPQKTEVHELGDENDSKSASAKSELVIGQADSLLIVGDSTKAVEKVVIRLSGG